MYSGKLVGPRSYNFVKWFTKQVFFYFQHFMTLNHPEILPIVNSVKTEI